MIEITRKIHVNDSGLQRPIALRTSSDVPDKVVLDVDTGYSVAGVTLDRQALLDLRDCCDSLLAEWFCHEEAIPAPLTYFCSACKKTDTTTFHWDNKTMLLLCNDCWRNHGNPYTPIKLSPAEVGMMGPLVAGGMDCTTFTTPSPDYIPCEVDEDPEYGMGITVDPGIKYVQDTIESLRRKA